MRPIQRVFLIILDSLGIGELPDAAVYGDLGSNTLRACYNTGELDVPNLQRMGLFNIDGVDFGEKAAPPTAAYARMAEQSAGKDTTIGHWEIAGLISKQAMPTYPNGFPDTVIREFERLTGRGTLCNQPYSGTSVLTDYGQEQVESGKLIIYTSAGSVFQIAAHEDVVPVDQLYACCRLARELLTGEHAVGRVIARPFTGVFPDYKRTPRRHDFSLVPPRPTILDTISASGLATIGIGKIYDIFAGQGISQTQSTVSNEDGMARTIELARQSWQGLCFVNLVEFDMIYGHRNDAVGYAQALNRFDVHLGQLLNRIQPDDVVMITADHGCDPSTPSTDHSREHVPLLIWGPRIVSGLNFGTRSTFADAGTTVAGLLNVATKTDGLALAGLLKDI